MKSIFFSLNLVLFLSVTSFSQTSSGSQTSIDDKQIRLLVQTFEDGWNKKDGHYFARPFAENADYVVINGMYITGRTVIAEAHTRIFESIYKEANIKAEVKRIRYLRPDIAVVHVAAQMSGTVNGQPVDSKASISLTTEKTAAGWQIAAFQNTAVEQR